MRSELKRIVLCCTLLLCCAGRAGASFQDPDTTFSESGPREATDQVEAAADTTYATEDDADNYPPWPVVYNRQLPSEARWLQATSNDEYNYRTKHEFVERQEPLREDPAWIRALGLFFAFFLTTPGKIILWSLLFVLVAYIVYRVIAGEGRLFSRRDLKAEVVDDSSELSEEGLMELNWAARMREALAAGEQRQAIRFGYLHVLQQLQGRDLIRFRPDKTNIAYYRELGERYRPGFRNLTRVYEFAWYGGFVPDAGGMSAYLDNLEQFLRSIPGT